MFPSFCRCCWLVGRLSNQKRFPMPELQHFYVDDYAETPYHSLTHWLWSFNYQCCQKNQGDLINFLMNRRRPILNHARGPHLYKGVIIRICSLKIKLEMQLSWNHDVTSMAKSAAQRTGLLRRVAPYLLPTQRAMIYKAIIRSKMEYASSAWFGTTPTSLSQLDAVQRRAIRIIDLPEDDLISHQIQPLGTRREVGALTLFHRMYYGEAPELLCQLLPEHLQLDPRLRRSVRSHDLAVQIPRSNLVSHKRSFVPSAARIWNSLPEYIPSLEERACFKKEVNRYLGDK